MLQISLDWFAAQRQTTTLRAQYCHYFRVKFSVESIGLGLFFLPEKEEAKKWLKPN